MSKRTRKQQQKGLSKPLMAFLGIGGLLLILAAIFFALQNNDTGGGTPKLVVDQDKIDYGNVHFGVNKTFAIKVTNTGDGVLRFKEKPYIQVLEGC
jgi:hypothetical protein